MFRGSVIDSSMPKFCCRKMKLRGRINVLIWARRGFVQLRAPCTSCRGYPLRRSRTNIELNYSGLNSFAGEFQKSNGNGQRKSSWAGAARVEVQHPVSPCDARLVRVTTDHGRNFRRRWDQIQLMHIVEHVNRIARQFEPLRSRQLGTGTASIDVAANGSEGSEKTKLLKDRDVAHVAAMENVIRAAQSIQGFRAKEAMRVRDN